MLRERTRSSSFAGLFSLGEPIYASNVDMRRHSGIFPNFVNVMWAVVRIMKDDVLQAEVFDSIFSSH